MGYFDSNFQLRDYASSTNTDNASGTDSTGGFFTTPREALGFLSGLANIGVNTYAQTRNIRNNTPEQTYEQRIVPDIEGPRGTPVSTLPPWAVGVGLLLLGVVVAFAVKN